MKRYIAPIIITAIAVFYFIGILFSLIFIIGPLPWFVAGLLLFIPLIGAGLFVAVLIQRIREIKGGEEDAASKY